MNEWNITGLADFMLLVFMGPDLLAILRPVQPFSSGVVHPKKAGLPMYLLTRPTQRGLGRNPSYG